MSRSHIKETFALTGGSPTTDAIANLVTTLRTDVYPFQRGVLIDNARGVCATISVDLAKTVVSGMMRCYALMPSDVNAVRSVSARRWMKYPNLDIDVIADTGVAASSERDIPLGDKQTLTGIERFIWLPDAVIGSAGATLLTVIYSVRRWAV